ncbi:glycosyltransferase [Citrobacter gillenii]|jgi:glycosyltransferase involved in cell wall biosynthesis|uniref:glycosyltransferase n=1 Tax=Citrobacter gillenii TaxID=67828 RepID=UPI00311CD099
MIIKKIFNKFESHIVNIRFDYNELSGFLTRNARDSLTVKYLSEAISNRNKHPSVTAVYRVKNGATFIELSILSVAMLCREIIIVDNGSTDSTLLIVEKLKNDLKEICDIKIFHYTQQVALAGNTYSDEVKRFPERSLAKYYNYAFSLATSDFVMKCDAHCIYTPAGINKIQTKLISKSNYTDVISFRGIEVFGAILACEPYLIRKDSFEYYDSIYFEVLKLKNKRTLLQKIMSRISMPCYIHVKRLSYIKMVYASKLSPVEYLYKNGS